MKNIATISICLLFAALVFPKIIQSAHSQTQIIGQASQDRKKVQEALNRIGCNAGTPDGIFDARTKRAIICFQKQAGVTETGDLSSAQFSLLTTGAYEESVRIHAQNSLNQLGCDAGPATGLWTEKSKSAVACFQGKIGRTADGNLTLDQLRRLIAAQPNSEKTSPPDTSTSVELTEEEQVQARLQERKNSSSSENSLSQPKQQPSDKISTPTNSKVKAGKLNKPKESPSIRDITKQAGPSTRACQQYYYWLATYHAAFEDAGNFSLQIRQFNGSGRPDKFVRLFEPQNLRRVITLGAMSANQLEDWYIEVDECLMKQFGVKSEDYINTVVLLSSLKQYFIERKSGGGLFYGPISASVLKTTELRQQASELLSEILDQNSEEIQPDEYQKLENRLHGFEKALGANAVNEHRTALNQLKSITQKPVVATKPEALLRASNKSDKNSQLCLSYVDPDEPNLPQGVAGVYEMPTSKSQLNKARVACKTSIDKDRGNALLHLASARLNLEVWGSKIAKTQFERAAIKGSISALAYLGDLEDDPQKALEYYQKAAEQGFEPAQEAQRLMSEFIFDQEELEADALVNSELLIGQCDALAAHPDDKTAPIEIDGLEDTEIDFELAFEACTAAIDTAPDHLRMVFNLGRTLSLVEELKEDAKTYLQRAHDAGHIPATYYLSGLMGRREEEKLLQTASVAGFERATDKLEQIIRYPNGISLSQIFVDPSRVLAFPSSNDVIEPKSFSVNACVREISAQVREDKVFQDEMSQLITGVSLAVCMMDENYCGVWNGFQATVRRDATRICKREERTFYDDYPKCLDPYWHEQNAEALTNAPEPARHVLKAYHAISGDIEGRSRLFDALVGNVTDLAAILYFEEIGVDFGNVSVSDLDEQFVLRDSVDEETRSLLAELKGENKYEIAINMMPEGLVCDR